MNPIRSVCLKGRDALVARSGRIITHPVMAARRRRRQHSRLGRILNVVQFDARGAYRRLQDLDELEGWLRAHHPDIEAHDAHLLHMLESERHFIHQLIGACERADRFFKMWSDTRKDR
ncbi:hypothetical protein RYH70_16725 [Alloalcanivorax xenomutans]|uniref:hypothetical protein n=1 Tax=Alloalcanivorax xenomutans TaxID=1094342 RepID=UPI0029347DB1|nr:hypothetical protein [Alloalcanivorax xenomutans]WOD27654.1 hypothetical protein RYH70_16725 [Alloalcanivorax xenomutans]